MEQWSVVVLLLITCVKLKEEENITALTTSSSFSHGRLPLLVTPRGTKTIAEKK
jgi:hypothetical protein